MPEVPDITGLECNFGSKVNGLIIMQETSVTKIWVLSWGISHAKSTFIFRLDW